MSERGQREQAIFVLAEDNHAVLKRALEERIHALSPEDVSERFDRLFVHLPDGTVRNRSGDGLEVVDAVSGEVRVARLYVAVLGASNSTYVEPVFSEDGHYA